jgi:holo-[acyl-carrier protein] synthase
MILGIGNDLIDIRRIERTLERYGERFLDRVFTDVERQKSDRRNQRAASYAKRFAANEACAKALGTGLNRGVYWRDMGVVNLPGGQPTIHLTGGALERLKQITPPGMTAAIHLTLTDDQPLAQAIVLISAEPATGQSAPGQPAPGQPGSGSPATPT